MNISGSIAVFRLNVAKPFLVQQKRVLPLRPAGGGLTARARIDPLPPLLIVSVAAALVTEPAELLATTVSLPLLAAETCVRVRLAPVAPAIVAPSLGHWNIGAGVPAAVAETRTVAPAATVWLAGWIVITGAVLPPRLEPRESDRRD